MSRDRPSGLALNVDGALGGDLRLAVQPLPHQSLRNTENASGAGLPVDFRKRGQVHASNNSIPSYNVNRNAGCGITSPAYSRNMTAKGRLTATQMADAKRLRALWVSFKERYPTISQQAFAQDNGIGTQGMFH